MANTGLGRFTQYTSQKEPVMTVGIIAAMLLAVVDRVFGLTDGDLALFGPIAVLVVATIMRQLAYSPASYLKALKALPPVGDEEPPDGV